MEGNKVFRKGKDDEFITDFTYWYLIPADSLQRRPVPLCGMVVLTTFYSLIWWKDSRLNQT